MVAEHRGGLFVRARRSVNHSFFATLVRASNHHVISASLVVALWGVSCVSFASAEPVVTVQFRACKRRARRPESLLIPSSLRPAPRGSMHRR